MKNVNIFLIVFLIVTLTQVLSIFLKKRKSHANDSIYCIMMTGKSPCRHDLARASIRNFIEQTYKYKYLIIVNHGDKPLLNDPTMFTYRDMMTEYIVKKEDIGTLGDMRNMALSRVPVNSAWTVWDDDDYRSTKYLEHLYDIIKRKKVSTVKFINRIEVNIKTNYVWKTTYRSGFATIMSIKKKSDKDLYTSKETMEDMELQSRLLANGHTFYTLDNDPYLYLRMVHGNNTSLYVNQDKTAIRKNIRGNNLKEEEIGVDEQKLLLDFFSNYYKEGIKCIQCLEN